ncbi:hypothetical protein K7X08_004393 [Anisodus acutangulus]|uniref:Uncharacterized protein n=1 Tax=Anisodus acutangulus TaxID=402998 RepID=A0A9Q1MHF0_9SOLA|nr:hypothetical protein K7X08_004393 [Anisodus acutangulus]
MENGVEVLDKGAKDGIGLVEMKESEGDEVFEEAIERETLGFGIEGGSLGSVTNYMDENVNSDSRDEVDNFEEVVKASHEIQQTVPSLRIEKKVHSYRDALLGDEVNAEVIETSNIQSDGHQDFVDVHKDVSFSSGCILKDERDIQLEEVHLNPSDEKEKSVFSTEPFNGSNKNEEHMDGPIDDVAPIAQIGRSCVKGVTGAVDIKDVLSCDATDLKGEESPVAALMNSNGKVQEYADEQKDVLSSDVLTGKDSPAMGPLDLSKMADEQKDVSVSGTSKN